LKETNEEKLKPVIPQATKQGLKKKRNEKNQQAIGCLDSASLLLLTCPG